MNKTLKIGRLGKKMQGAETKNGNKVFKFSLFVDDPYDKENPNIFNCEAYGKVAEIMISSFKNEYLKPGSRLGIEGRDYSKPISKGEGQRTEFYSKINVESIDFLDRKKDVESDGGDNKSNAEFIEF